MDIGKLLGMVDRVVFSREDGSLIGIGNGFVVRIGKWGMGEEVVCVGGKWVNFVLWEGNGKIVGRDGDWLVCHVGNNTLVRIPVVEFEMIELDFEDMGMGVMVDSGKLGAVLRILSADQSGVVTFGRDGRVVGVGNVVIVEADGVIKWFGGEEVMVFKGEVMEKIWNVVGDGGLWVRLWRVDGGLLFRGVGLEVLIQGMDGGEVGLCSGEKWVADGVRTDSLLNFLEIAEKCLSGEWVVEIGDKVVARNREGMVVEKGVRLLEGSVRLNGRMVLRIVKECEKMKLKDDGFMEFYGGDWLRVMVSGLS